MNIKRLTSTDKIAILLVLLWISDMNFSNLSIIQWIGLGLSAVLFLLLGIKIIMR